MRIILTSMIRVDTPPSAWKLLGDISPTALADTSLELHWAVQLIGAVPLALLPPESDARHANLGWLASAATFVTRPVGRAQPARFGLRVPDFSLVVLDADGATTEELALSGQTLDDGYAWIARAMEHSGEGKTDPGMLQRPGDDFPQHTVGSGAPFTGGAAEARCELAHWYDNALLVLSEVAQLESGASEVRTWPHHFDMATLITLESADAPESMRSVGVGLSPGDSSYTEPYLYVTPWPYPEDATLSPLSGQGLWHTEGWTGAVLTGTRLVEGADESIQARRARSFLATAIPAARRLACA